MSLSFIKYSQHDDTCRSWRFLPRVNVRFEFLSLMCPLMSPTLFSSTSENRLPPVTFFRSREREKTTPGQANSARRRQETFAIESPTNSTHDVRLLVLRFRYEILPIHPVTSLTVRVLLIASRIPSTFSSVRLVGRRPGRVPSEKPPFLKPLVKTLVLFAFPVKFLKH